MWIVNQKCKKTPGGEIGKIDGVGRIRLIWLSLNNNCQI